MGRMANGTGMRFREGTWLWWHEFWWNLGWSADLRISIREVSGAPAQASVGKVGSSFLYIEGPAVDNIGVDSNERLFNHEMGHVFGLEHEHQRDDRDDYINVSETGLSYDKIDPETEECGSFLWWSWCSTRVHVDTYGTPYDYQSVMHYYSYVPTGITLTSAIKDEYRGKCWIVYADNQIRWGSENGNTYFTPWDIYAIKRLYGLGSNSEPPYTPTVRDGDNESDIEDPCSSS